MKHDPVHMSINKCIQIGIALTDRLVAPRQLYGYPRMRLGLWRIKNERI